MKGARIGETNMVTDSTEMIGVECPIPLRGVGLTLLGSKMTGVSSVRGEEFQSTPENQALMQDPLSFKVWSIGTELTEKAMTEMYPPAAEYTSQDQSVSAEPSGPR